MNEVKKQEYIPLISNALFRTVMTSSEHIDFIKFLIKEIVGEKDKEFLNKHLEITSQVLPIEHVNQKQGETDVLYKIGNNFYVNLEANTENSLSLRVKNHSYLCRIFCDYFYRGKEYENGKVIQINLNSFNQGKEIINKYQMMDIIYHEIESENLEKYHINLKKLLEKERKMCYNDINNKLTHLERALLLFVEKDKDRLEELAKGVSSLEKIVRRIEKMNEDKYIIGLYDREAAERKYIGMLKNEYKEYGIKEGMQKGMQKGMKKGVTQGIKQGIQQGIQRGIAQGKMEGIYATAKNMLKENIDFSMIQKVTNLSVQELTKLQAEE